MHINEANAEIETLIWNESDQTGTKSAYLQYLALYPSGKYIMQANKALAAENAWEGVVKINSEKAYQDFIASYPQSKKVTKAVTSLHALSWASYKQKLLKAETQAKDPEYSLINRLRGRDAVERAYAAMEAINNRYNMNQIMLALIELLPDNTELEYQRGGIGKTSPSAKASAVLIKAGKSAVQPLISYMLYYPRATRSAAFILGEIQDTIATNPLIYVLQHPEIYNSANAAASSLGKLKDKRALPYLLMGIQGKFESLEPSSNKCDTEIGCTHAVIKFGSAATDQLMSIIMSPSTPINSIRNSLFALGKIGVSSESIIQQLEQLLSTTDDYTKKYLVDALDNLRNKEALKKIESQNSDE
ncbi:MAG: hypothetical protein PHO32_06595 [Candidatus Cloacimonetes bacterium]|nr:hypothetical protein [Candidatus Cloacimonadota bacterium]